MSQKPSKAAEAIRARLKSRRTESRERPISVPFVVDVELADRVGELVRERQQIEDRLRRLAERVDDGEPDPDGDVRADGRDLTPSTAMIASLEEALDRVEDQLETMKQAVAEGSATLLFRLATDAEYEQHLAEVERDFAGPHQPQSVTVEFGNRLLRDCFLRVEKDGEDLGYTSWQEVHDDWSMTFGDVDPIRTTVVAKNRRSGAFKLPF